MAAFSSFVMEVWEFIDRPLLSAAKHCR